MTFNVSLTGHAKDSGKMPSEQELALVSKHVASLRAKLEAAGLIVSACTVNGSTVLTPPTDTTGEEE